MSPILQVHIVSNTSGTEEDEYESSHLSHIGQIFFEDALVEDLLTHPPYSQHGSEQITYLAQDSVYTGDTTTIANVTYLNPDDLQWGATAVLEAIVDPQTVAMFVDSMSGAMGMGNDTTGRPPLGLSSADGAPAMPVSTAG